MLWDDEMGWMEDELMYGCGVWRVDLICKCTARNNLIRSGIQKNESIIIYSLRLATTNLVANSNMNFEHAQLQHAKHVINAASTGSDRSFPLC